MTTRIDEQTANKISLIVKACREHGADPVAALDRAGYLVHPAMVQMFRDQTIREIYNLINQATPTQLGGGRVPATAAEMKRCILKTIEGMVG